MQIEIKSVEQVQKSSAAGKPYTALELSYKNLANGKIEGKTLMPFGGNKASYDILKSANSGQIFDVSTSKNTSGYWDWTSAVAQDGSAPTQQSVGKTNAPVRSTYETPEERAHRQVLIVRQSSISSAVAALTPGAKAALDTETVVRVARAFEDYVFGKDQAIISGTQGLIDMEDDIPL